LASLNALINVEQVPKILKEFESTRTSDLEPILVVTPVASPVIPVINAITRVSGYHLKQLVRIVQKAHEMNICHRDIIITYDHLQLLLNDWGSTVFKDFTSPKTYRLIGTRRYFDPMDSIEHQPSREHDLLLVVRTAFALIFSITPPSTDSELFWGNAMKPGTLWEIFLENAKSLNYDLLDTQLSQMIGDI
jgi:serine/threonine protein kinase